MSSEIEIDDVGALLRREQGAEGRGGEERERAEILHTYVENVIADDDSESRVERATIKE